MAQEISQIKDEYKLANVNMEFWGRKLWVLIFILKKFITSINQYHPVFICLTRKHDIHGEKVEYDKILKTQKTIDFWHILHFGNDPIELAYKVINLALDLDRVVT